jgi:hypothetical protein
MKIYWLFGGECYYASGGMNDYVGRFETIEEATAAAKERFKDLEWWHVLNLDLGIIVANSDDTPYGQSTNQLPLPTGLGS